MIISLFFYLKGYYLVKECLNVGLIYSWIICELVWLYMLCIYENVEENLIYSFWYFKIVLIDYVFVFGKVLFWFKFIVFKKIKRIFLKLVFFEWNIIV